MMKFTTAIALVILLSSGALSARSESSITPSQQLKGSITPFQLTCEYLTNPTGLDIPHPRFSWKLTATDKTAFGQKQTAYRILVSSSKVSGSKVSGSKVSSNKVSSSKVNSNKVSSSKVSSSTETLNRNKGDMWDSGWIPSDDMQLIKYDGKPLQSDQTYYWTVAVKDEKGNESVYAKTAEWSTGLFSQDEWTAKWIGTDEVYNPAEGSNKMQDPWFRKTFDLKEKPTKATLFVASVGYHEVYVNGQKIGDHVLAPAVTDHTKRARYIAYDIAPALNRGKNVIALWLGTSWSIFAPYATPDKPRTPIVIAQADLYDREGEKMIRIGTDESWKTHPSPNKLIGNWG
ncbi:MAG: alpha-L-rhamnosidase N-terminal domain-containing protein, partial [Proteiniphilum sp.]